MNNAEPELLPVNFQSMISDVWVYVNPLTGKHAKTTSTGKLAVFLNEEIGRSWEKISTALTGMIGYTATWDEMLEISNSQTRGEYELFTAHNN
jgi:hypothetical protein